MTHFTSLVIIMLLVGAAGGVVNYYTQSIKHTVDRSVLTRSVVLGVAMTFVVPYILSLSGSTLITESEGNPARLLDYVAVCLAVSFLPRFFMANVSDNVLNEARLASDKIEQLQYQLKQLQDELLPLIDTETETDNPADAVMISEAETDDLDTTSSRVLKTLGCGRFIYRSLTGLCSEADTDESTMMKTLNFLTLRSLAGKVGGRKGVRWYITERGRKLVEVSAYNTN